jgi:hypothetical protein
MKFFNGVKTKIGEAKQGISDMNDRRKVSDLMNTLSSFPLCSESDAYTIVNSVVTKYLGRSYTAKIDFENSSSEEVLEELAELDAVEEKIRKFLTLIFEQHFEHDVKNLQGSICVSFLAVILDFLDVTETVIDQDMYEEILTIMIKEASGFDIELHFGPGSTADIYQGHASYKNEYFPTVFFRRLEEMANEKLQTYKRSLSSKKKLGNPMISEALSRDTIGSGRSMDIYSYQNHSWSEGYVGIASVPRMIEYYLPLRILRELVVFSFYNLSNEMTTIGNVNWHFCEDGILQVDLTEKTKPRWISKAHIQELTFGEGYNGRSSNGVTEFEEYYIYMTVKPSLREEFTLFRFLNKDRKGAERNLKVYLNETLPKLEKYYPVKVSQNVYDISKHYKTSYTTTYVWGEF